MSISVRSVSKRWGNAVGLDDVSLEVASGELVALLGPSGSGKTTLLRVIGGLEVPDQGTVLFAGADATRASVRERGVGFVFQHYALFRHLTVFENIAFGLRVMPRMRRPPRVEIERKVERLLELVQLQGLARRLPSQLSGGQRQRVALARALAVEPKVLLLDEPFGALDARVRQELRRWLRRLHDEIHVTSVFVTHDQEEALEVADRVVVMTQGKVAQIGTPSQVMDHPDNAFVNEFVGEVNVLEGEVRGDRVACGALALDAAGLADGTPVRVLIRTHDIKLWHDPAGIMTIERLWAMGDRVRVEASIAGDGTILAQFPRRSSLLHRLEPGTRAAIEVTMARLYTGDGLDRGHKARSPRAVSAPPERGLEEPTLSAGD